ncbi:hypothetical protein J3L16_12485 [Alteromonas sp. 5E99-2]|uniref:hypothetical protein n=1 Tax=Alteromonas sp. 5E99-2 TaxID=2817683 RepID=UPI001A98220E|nr:hypothetical protein [Alteromonas sp. 5E99-2]MBO1256501.1 hypothetical protein [Alteromonas sp. 5E99-2]
MATLHFHQIYPYQALPKLARETDYSIPKRAKSFCYPFKTAANKGVYAFPPINFSIFMSDEYLDIRAEKKEGGTFYKRIPKKQGGANFVLLSDVDKKGSDTCLSAYRKKIKTSGVGVPESIDVDTFGFYEIMLNVIVEEDPFDFYLQVWLGGVVDYESAGGISVKHPTNVDHNSGFICLDADINTEVWKGWFAVVLKPTRKEEWIEFNQDKPICQIIGAQVPIEALCTHEFENLSDRLFFAPLEWHIFEGDYGLKPGKYQREVRSSSGK